MTGDADHVPRPRRLLRGDRAAVRCCAIPGSPRRTSGRGFRSPATTGSTRHAFASPDYLYISHLHRDHFDPEWLAAPRRQAAHGCCSPSSASRSSSASCVRSGSRLSCARRTASRSISAAGSTATILAFTAPADGPLGDSLIVLDDGTHACAQPERRPARRPRRAARARAVRRADGAVLGRDLVSDRVRLPAPTEAQLAAEKRVNQMARAQQYVEWVGRARTSSRARGRRPSSTPTCSRSTTSTATRRTSSPIRPCSSNSSTRAGIDTGASARSGLGRRARRRRVQGHAARRRRRGRTAVHRQARVPRGVPARLGAVAGRGARVVVARPVATSSPSSRRGSNRSSNARRSRRPASRGTSCSTSANRDANVCIDFVESRGARVARRAVRLQGRRRPPADRGAARAPHRRLGQLAVPLVPVRRAPTGPVELQRVRDDVLQGAVARTHRLRRALLPRATHAHDDEFFERDGWRIERWCPHRQADLSRFGEIADGVLTCSLHHWQFDLATGRCLTSDDRHLRCDGTRIAGSA